MKTIQVNLVDRIEVPTQRTMTDAGQMIVPCAFARTGTLQYSAGSLGLPDKPADEMVSVFRDEAEVFAEDSMSSFRSAPVTIGHPRDEAGAPINVTAENAKELQVGVLEGLPTRDEDMLTGDLVIARQDAIDMIEAGTVELSAGYTCDLVMNDEGELFQKNIRANHIAIVEKGRAGSACRIADELEEARAKQKETDSKTKGDIEDKTEVNLADELENTKATVAVLNDEIETLKATSATIEAERDLAKAEVVKLQDALEASTEDRVNAILTARKLTDLTDFTGKTVAEIKLAVVADQMPQLSLEGKGEAYVEAMFDILVDADDAETPMSKLLRKEKQATVVEDAKPVDKVSEARQNMIDRHKA